MHFIILFGICSLVKIEFLAHFANDFLDHLVDLYNFYGFLMHIFYYIYSIYFVHTMQQHDLPAYYFKPVLYMCTFLCACTAVCIPMILMDIACFYQLFFIL